jgi:hypothetical protein
MADYLPDIIELLNECGGQDLSTIQKKLHSKISDINDKNIAESISRELRRNVLTTFV